MREYPPKPWRYIPRDEEEVRQDKFGHAFIHPHLRFMMFAAVRGMPMMKCIVLNHEQYGTISY